jgi:hypothetical protein
VKRLLILPIAVLALAVAAPAATADYELTVENADTYVVAPGDRSSIAVDYSLFCIQIFGCSSNETISSTDGFTQINDAQNACGGGAAPSLSCPELPNTRVVATENADTVNGSCLGKSSRLLFNGLGGNDEVNVLCSGSQVDVGPGEDVARVSGSLAGGAGNDDLTGGALGDTIDGGDGRDRIRGVGGDDTLRGGSGRDLLTPGLGNDLVEGGPETDTVAYEDRDASQGVAISLDNAANDGQAGEADRIANDVENAIGSPAGDTIVGDDGPNDIEGGDGGDVIDPRGGADFVDAGFGNDRITARDGVPDRIECGDGNDQAVIDAFDTATGCEDVQASRELMPDVDADGVPAPADCDDRDGRRRPGFTDRPGNGLDEDCAAGDAPFTRILSPVQSLFSTRGRVTRVLRLRVLAVPEGGQVQLRCRGRGCFRGVKRFRAPRGKELQNIRRPVRTRRLRSGARLEVRVLDADSIGKVVRFTMRRRALPSSRTLCLPPGQTRPGRCARR